MSGRSAHRPECRLPFPRKPSRKRLRTNGGRPARRSIRARCRSPGSPTRRSLERRAFALGLANYAEADLACYRSEWPPELVGRQTERWDSLVAWARRRYDVDFATTSGLLHVAQPPATVERLAQAVGELDAFHLAGLSPLVTSGGSLLAGLALLEKAITPEAAWDAVSVDDRWQLEQWGKDAEAEAALENRRRDFVAAARFLELLD